MKISRRQFLGGVVAAACFRKTASAVAADQHANTRWEEIARQWMQALIPGDAHGPGADSPQVWHWLHQGMHESKSQAAILTHGFALLRGQTLPMNAEGVSTLLLQDSEAGRFLRYFFDLLADAYYGSALGWHDLGLEAPPQPQGFLVETPKM